jgi:alanyl-tRNA synthetase
VPPCHASQVIGDHTRAVLYLVSDGVNASNTGRGYIVRRLLRRVVLKVGRRLWPHRNLQVSTNWFIN